VTTGLRLGAPGIYRVGPGAAPPALTAVALDEAGFAGVAARGPVDKPVAVGSYAEYLLRFGTGPGLLPLAVAAFFAQGGRRAQVLRVGPDLPDAHTVIEQGTRDAAGCWTPLRTTGGAPVRWLARDPGRWGDAVTVTLTSVVDQRFTVTAAATGPAVGPVGRSAVDADRVVVPPTGLRAPAGSLLHVRGEKGRSEIRWIEATADREVSTGVRRTTWVLDRPLPQGAPTLGLVVATVEVHDHAPEGPTVEAFDVGLSSRHPRWLAAVLATGSRLVTPDPAWEQDAGADGRIALADPLLPPIDSILCRSGADNYGDVTVADLLGRTPDEAPDVDPTCEHRHHGAERLARTETLGLLAVPDLAWNGVVPFAVMEEPPASAPDGFAPCTGARPAARLSTPGVDATYLDGRLPDELAALRARQQWLVGLAEATQRFVVLLDAPQGLSAPAVAAWRTGFDSAYAAAYHPWLGVLPDPPGTADPGDTARLAPPSAFAAGIVAATEIAVGLPTGPANALAAGAVTLGEQMTDAEHATLHPLGVNVFRAERDGFRLTAARTLALDPAYRQLTVRRLVTMLRLTLERESQWVVFEPHTAALRAVLVLHVADLLREQFRAGAFSGATETDSFFVRSGEDLNPPESVALGRIVLEVGIAPSAPLEFLVLRVTHDGDAVDVQEVSSA
jgi:hypothetical protein